MKQLILENYHVYQLGGELTSSEIGRQKAGYDFSIPPYVQSEYDSKSAELRFLVLTVSNFFDPAEVSDQSPGREASCLTNTASCILAHLDEIWDYAAANDIRDVYVLSDRNLIRGQFGFFSFVSRFPKREDVKLHLCLTADDINGLSFRDLQELREMRPLDFPSDPAEAVREGSGIYLFSDDIGFGPEEKAELYNLEHPPSRLKGSREIRYIDLLDRLSYLIEETCFDLGGVKSSLLTGWSDTLMQVCDLILLPVNDCVDVCMSR